MSLFCGGRMDVFECIRRRRSIRAYKKDHVSEDHLKEILKAATWAPSAGNLQSWEFIIVRDHTTKVRLAEAAYGQYFIVEAPVIIVVCANEERSASRYGDRGRTLYTIQDTAAAIQNMLLAAYALGYGTCWVGAFNENDVKRILDLPKTVRPVAIVPLGRPNENPVPPRRLELKRVVHLEKFGNHPKEF